MISEDSLNLPFQDRSDAGRLLGQELRRFAGRDDVIVLALPRGGVPVAFEVADALGVELDLMLVRKLGAPGQEELAMGAIASGGARVLNADVVQSLLVSEAAIEVAVQRESRELERRERAYRGTRPPPRIAGRTVLLVDDGLATGATMRAAVAAVRALHPASVVVAVPVAPPETLRSLETEADEVVCLAAPPMFYAVGQWYADFPQTTDEEVVALLQRAWATRESR